MRVEISNSKSQISSRKPKSRNPRFQECYCYIVECADGTFYTGWTTNLERRLAAHNAGRGSRYTRSRRPVKLVYFETFYSRAQALRREVAIKRMPRSTKLAQVCKFKSQSSSLSR